MFESGDVRLGPGLSISRGRVDVKKTVHFYIAVTNTVNEERDLPDQILIGHLEEIGRSVPQSTPELCLWTMVHHRLTHV